MAIDYSKYIDHIFKSDWIYSIVKEEVDGVTGYYIKFYDHSFIFGTLGVANSGQVFNATFVCNYTESRSPMCMEFVDYMDDMFEERSYSAKIMNTIYKKARSLDKTRKAIKQEVRSVKDLKVEMIDAANIEDYEGAARIKKLIDSKL